MARLTTCLTLLFSIVAASAPAATIELWTGQKVADAEIVKIDGGIVYFTYGDAKSGKIELLKIKSMSLEAAGKAKAEEGPPPGAVELVRFEDYELTRYKGRIVEVAINVERARLREPFIRVFSLQQDADGQREVHMFVNERVIDPSVVHQLDEVKSVAYKRKAFFLRNEDAVIAWRVEVWIDGELGLSHMENAGEDIREAWWRTQKARRTGRLEPIDADGKAEEENVPNLRCTAVQCQVSQGLEQKYPIFTIGYTLASEEARVALPQATLYILTEDESGERNVTSRRCESEANAEVSINRNLNRKLEPVAIKSASLAAKGLREDGKAKDDRRLAAWRLEIHYGKAIIGLKESPNTEFRESLGEEWWKE